MSRQVITAGDIREAGITRLNNVFVLFDGVRFTTVDGFTMMPSFNGLAAMQERVWRVEVDGQPVDDGVLEAQSLNTLGLPITSIDRIVVYDVPHVRRGRLERGGVIEIWTRGGREDGFLRSVVAVGNETGDPGPYRYSDPDLDNVDKEGPDVAIEGGFSRSDVAVHMGATMNQIIPSDPAVFGRNTSVFDDPETPVMRVIAPFVSLKSALPGGDIAFRASASLFDDMLYTQSIGREIPAEHRRAGLTGVANTKALGIDWRVNTGVSQRVVRNFDSATRIPFHWDERSAAVSIDGGRMLGKGSLSGGLALDYVGVQSDNGLATRESFVIPRAHFGFGRQLGAVKASGSVFAAFDETGRSGGATVAAAWSLPSGQSLTGNVSVAQTLPIDANPLAFWAYRGLTLAPSGNVVYPGAEEESRLASADFQWSWSPTDRHLLQVAGVGRRFAGLRLANRSLVPDGEGFAVDSVSYDAGWGATIGVRLRAELHRRNAEYALSYSYQTALDGNALFYDTFATISRRQARLTAVHRIAERFSVTNTLYHFSKSRWSEFEEIGEASGYSARVPGFLRWDVAFYKGLADDKLQLTFVFENILNDRVGYHPIGATFDRALRVQLAVVLD